VRETIARLEASYEKGYRHYGADNPINPAKQRHSLPRRLPNHWISPSSLT
jgi:hypothetical protein